MTRPRSLSLLLHNVGDSTSFNDGDVKLMEQFARAFLEKLENDLIARKSEWYDLGTAKLAYVVSQLEAIAYAILIKQVK